MVPGIWHAEHRRFLTGKLEKFEGQGLLLEHEGHCDTMKSMMFARLRERCWLGEAGPLLLGSALQCVQTPSVRHVRMPRKKQEHVPQQRAAWQDCESRVNWQRLEALQVSDTGWEEGVESVPRTSSQ